MSHKNFFQLLKGTHARIHTRTSHTYTHLHTHTHTHTHTQLNTTHINKLILKQ